MLYHGPEFAYKPESEPESSDLVSVSREVRNEHCLQFYRSQFETEADFRDTLQEFILTVAGDVYNWKDLCALDTRTLCGLVNLTCEFDEH